ncbi:MAG: glycosyltransferase family 2 protein [Oscillospiraceae bacterium]|nr:glycosyltransferase family 2 protein [Candidatus Limimonas egerieequi]
MSKPLVSIIMPVYGVEDYVGKAIESIQNQTYKNFEFFCVDDGTKDRSGAICDEYAKNDNRIIVIHKENGGAPSARNVAIDQAQGKYFYFMDSDDWTEPTMLEDMVTLAEQNDLQLVVSGYYIDTYYSDEEKFVQEQSAADVVYKTQQDFRNDAHRLFDKNLLYTPWNKLYSAEYIKENKLYFPQTFWDDFPFNLSVLRDVERVGVLSKKYYHFIRKRQESETAKYRPNMYDKREEEADWMEDLYKHWNIDSSEIEEFLARRYIERVIGCIENLTNPSCTLPFLNKCKEIRRIAFSERVQNAIKVAQPNSKYMKLMLIPIKLKLTLLTYIEGKTISFVKTRNTKVFAELKAHR